MEIFLVGGAVRDKLLGLPVKERDWVVVGATPPELIAQGFKPVGKDFPVFLHPKTNEEYALARTERKSGHGYRGFTFHTAPDVSLEADLQRRDLTINAIAENSDGALIDPYNGQKDLADKYLRHVSAAFSEDPVRLLRIARFAARFASLGFSIAPTTYDLMRTMVENGEVDHLVAERVWQECAKALSTATPAVFFEVLEHCNALERVLSLPKIKPESYAALTHASRMSDDVEIRLAAFLFHNDFASTQTLCQRLKLPNNVNELIELTIKHYMFFQQCTELPPADVLQGLKSLDAFRREARFKQFLVAATAVAHSTQNGAQRPLPQIEYLMTARSNAQAVNARDLANQQLSGLALAEELDRHRCAVISKVKRTYRWSQI
ncbi:MAG: multifunctional CCA tRNA nucleotidyl transferase/2'3'-cyclic phosphodiesterase/2'nucleotidase/phosphatase [Gammaproteobacteria bacterium]|nr:multifunctional CCA tRNA nucleotidyl transferase/2'3'-cyclic phosphodiesterase/2'nucleotidase/phosphatase [Gammaproteobacteria bacterium]